MPESRQLAAILFTDIAGYTAMMQENEAIALGVIRHYSSVLKDSVRRHQGTIINDYGDGNLCTFTSATEAMRCAMDLQRAFQSEPKVPLRVGLHIGEIFFEDGKVFGDGVNVASRIQSLGVTGSVLFSGEAYHKVKNQTEFKTVSLGNFHFKNVTEPMEVYALTNEGLMVPQRGSMEGKIKVREGSIKKGIAVAAVILIVVASIYSYKKLSKQDNPVDIKKSVAVLAFADLSEGKDQEWFSDGIAEEIINSLANLDELKVISRTSSFYFKGKDVSFAEIADKLGVDHIIEGSVRRVDDQLRITVQLIRADDEFHLFSETYNRSSKDLLMVQSEIAEMIAIKLLGQLNPETQSKIEKYKPSSVEAYEYYLRAGEALLKLSRSPGEPESYDAARALMLKAISLDPDYLPAYWRLLSSYNWQFGTLDGEKYLELRDSIVQVVHMRSPNSVYSLLGRHLTFVKRMGGPNLDSAFHYLQKAYKIDPHNPEVVEHCRNFYLRIGLMDIGNNFLIKSLELNPMDMVGRRILAWSLELVGDWKGSENEFKKIVEVTSSALDERNLVAHYILNHKLEAAKERLGNLEKLDTTQFRFFSRLLRVAEGNKDEALKLESPGPLVWSLFGMKSEMIRHLDEYAAKSIPVVDEISGNVAFSLEGLDKGPLWSIIRDEPQFKHIRERVKKDHDEKLRKYGNLLSNSSP